jgi:murein DD-endopeptidase MepM/ murein hydrolase activator NlpD
VARRLVLGLAVALLLVLAGTAAGDTITDRKQTIDARIESLRSRVASAQAQESGLRAQIADVTTRIRDLERRVGDVALRLGSLEGELSLRELRLNQLNELFRIETDRFHFLRAQYDLAARERDRRLVAIYESDDPGTLDVVLSSTSLGDLLDKLDFVKQVNVQDRRIADEVLAAKQEAKAARLRTKYARARVAREAQVIAVRTAQVRQVHDELVSNRDVLANSRAAKQESLSKLSAGERADVGEIDALAAVSAGLQSRILAAQSATRDTTPSSSGLIWPVSGPITSPFGWRWGRMHEGIDIGVGYGTPIGAAAGGTVIYAGWMEGYGNLVVIDHGGGLATAYGHQERIAVSVGEQVTQGQTIGYVGCTGHCFGPHLHFEVRVNGAPVDPLGYL